MVDINDIMTLSNYDIWESPKFIRFCMEKGIKKATQRKYVVCLNRYVEYHQKTLETLLEEAEQEIIDEIPLERRKIYDWLLDFRTSMLQKGYAYNTIITTMDAVKNFYKQFRIPRPDLPSFKGDKSPNDLIEWEDLPNMDMVKEAIENVNTAKHKALFLFCAVTGTARMETANFTYGQFLEGIQHYCPNAKTPQDIIDGLDGKCEELEVVPVFKMCRSKTQYLYYTAITPECTQFMINYLKRQGLYLTEDDKFFQLSPHGVGNAFKLLNNKMKWGKKGTFDYFSSHRLRKFNASIIGDLDFANYIQGRVPTKIREVYFKQDKERVREEYKMYMHLFTVYANYDVLINSEAYQSLLDEKNRLSDELDKAKEDYQNLLSKVDDMRNEIDNVSRLNDIAKIQDYIVDNKIVNEYNLSSKIIDLYKADVKKDDFEGVTNSYIDDLIMIARNNVVALESISFQPQVYNDDVWKKINAEIDLYVSDYMDNLSLELTDGLRKRISDELNDYAIELWQDKGKVDRVKVEKIVERIALGVNVS